MNEDTIEICGQTFRKDSNSFSFGWSFSEIQNMNELDKLGQFSNLKSANFGLTNLNDLGLQYICKCPNIENLDLQGTQISDEGIKHLSGLESLKTLRLKENAQLTNHCVKDINSLLNLVDLQIHETSINQHGLKDLRLPKLENLLVDIWNDNYRHDFLLDLSTKLPDCSILAKGQAEFLNGKLLWSE